MNVAKASRISREEFCHVFFLKAHEINHASVGNKLKSCDDEHFRQVHFLMNARYVELESEVALI